MSRTSRRPSPALVVAALALFVALGGVSYAAATIGSAQIKNNSIKGKDIKNRTIKTSDISKKARNALKGQTGARGATGPAGPQGVQGPVGQTGPMGPSTLRSDENTSSFISLPTCTDTGLGNCTAILSVTLGAGSHLIQAKTNIDNADVTASDISNRCGIVMGEDDVLDEARTPLYPNSQPGEAESIALAKVVTAEAGTVVSLRCTELGGEALRLNDPRLTALQVGSVNP